MHQLAIQFLLLSAMLMDIYAVSVKQKMVDLTYAYDENSTSNYPTNRIPDYFKLKVNVFYLHGFRVVTENYSTTTHAGTHIDAPSKFFTGSTTVDNFPLEQLSGPAAVVDISARAALDPNAELTVEDLLQYERTTGQTLNGTIVLMRSGYGKLYNNKALYTGTSESDYNKLRFPGVSPEAALFMVTKRMVKGAGVDTLSIDRGLTKDYLSHRTLLGSGRFILENVANLENVPVYGATLNVSPMKIANAGAAPVRLIATYPEVIFSSNKLY